MTPGDAPNVLVAMNPAALKANLKDLPRGADIIVNTDEFTPRDLTKVGYAANPLEDDSLEAYNLHPIALTSHDGRGAQGLRRHARRRPSARRTCSRSACSPGCYNRPTEGTIAFLEAKFGRKPDILEANIAAFRAGWNFGETTEDFAVSYEIKPAPQAAGHLPQHHRQPRAVLRAGRRGAAHRAAAVPGLLPDHAGLGHPARAEQAQALRRPHLPGRGRDRRHRRRARRGLRRLARR